MPALIDAFLASETMLLFSQGAAVDGAAALLRVAEAVAGSQRVAQRAPTQAPGALLA